MIAELHCSGSLHTCRVAHQAGPYLNLARKRANMVLRVHDNGCHWAEHKFIAFGSLTGHHFHDLFLGFVWLRSASVE